MAGTSGATRGVVSAEIVRIDRDFVIVNAGLKSEAYIPLVEFKDDRGELQAQVGDSVAVVVDSAENGYGDSLVSRDKARRLASWARLETAQAEGSFVLGTVLEKVEAKGKSQGGLTVVVDGVQGFVPASQMGTPAAEGLEGWVGQTVEFQVLRLERGRSEVLLSRRAVQEASERQARAELLQSLREGSVVSGVVRRIVDFGAFVDIGGMSGLLHISDMARRPPKHPGELLQVDQVLQLKVLHVDVERDRVSLGLKQMSAGSAADTVVAPAAPAAAAKPASAAVAGAGVTRLGDLLREKFAHREAQLATPPASARITVERSALSAAATEAVLQRLPDWVAGQRASELVRLRVGIPAATDPARLAQTVLEAVPEAVAAAWLHPGFASLDADELMTVGLFASGAARTIGSVSAGPAGQARLQPFDVWSLLDPDAEMPLQQIGKGLESELTVLAVKVS